ncbi:F-box protein-like protein [Tanacetum coccineum]|uniref:F-box protein-like protein n=1 Tax=Tanacetum coccineum TaxID=301880 RepID=A0ABQ5CSZ7_9ASTR
MSDNIPLEIQTEIIKRAPDVKSLIRFRAVSKTWKSFIDSSEFIGGYRARKTQPHTLLLRYTNNYQPKYVSVNNDTFTQQQDLAPNVSALMKQLDDTLVIGYSRGLLCLYAFDKGGMLVLWNPSIRRCVGILGSGYFGVFGFAVCPVTNEPTIVKISFPWKVQLFTLSSKKWTEIECRRPRESITLHERTHVVIDSCIYRVAYETSSLPNGFFTVQYMILSFDLIAKEFKAIDLPDKITIPFTSPVRFCISKLKGSLFVIVPHREVKVWKMEPNCSFTQLFTINTPDSYISHIVGFRKNGELLVETQERRGRLGFYGEARGSALETYDPCSQHISNLGFSVQNGSFFISSYKETLHLLDHSDSCVYPEIN